GLRRRPELVACVDQRVADLELGVHDLAAGAGRAVALFGAEDLLVEVDCLGAVGQAQMRNDRVGAIGNGLDCHDATPFFFATIVPRGTRTLDRPRADVKADARRSAQGDHDTPWVRRVLTQ